MDRCRIIKAMDNKTSAGSIANRRWSLLTLKGATDLKQVENRWGPRESLIFQYFPDIGPATAPILAAFAGFQPGGDPLNEFIFGSFFFSRNVV